MDETTEAQQGLPPIPPMPPAPPGGSRGNRRSFLAGAAVGAVVAAALTAGGFLLTGESKSSSAAAEEDSKPAATASASPVESEAVEEAEESEDPGIYNRTPDASDFRLDLKTTSKHCFGSAGCNVTVEPDLTYTDAFPLDPSATISITYEVRGDESGPVIETMELTSQDQLSFTPVSISTPGSGTKITAKVTDVQVSP